MHNTQVYLELGPDCFDRKLTQKNFLKQKLALSKLTLSSLILNQHLIWLPALSSLALRRKRGFKIIFILHGQTVTVKFVFLAIFYMSALCEAFV